MKRKTEELLELMKSSTDYRDYLEENKGELTEGLMRVDRALNAALADRKLKKSEVIARSGIETHYAYQIFSGTKVPTRDKVLMLCIALRMTPEETQNFLKLTGYALLYGRESRDNVILFGLTRHLSVIDVNGILDDQHLGLLL